MTDLHNNMKASRGISPIVGTDDTAFVSQIVDTQGFGSTEFVFGTGTLSDANCTAVVLVEDGNISNLSDNAAVPDIYLLGTEAGAAIDFADDNEVRKIGYLGPKRYVRVTITPSGNTGNIPIAGFWIQGHPRVMPQSSQAT